MDKAIARIRAFNRFYTSTIGVLDKHILESNFSLSEARVLYELSQMEDCTARKIMHWLKMDEGYLSRIIERFIQLGLVQKTRSDKDKRAYHLALTAKGKTQFQKINTASARAVRDMIKSIPEKEVELMLMMMESIQNILTKSHEAGNTK
jgi:DNA-binding MarR family transcriptional regulator